MGWLFNTKDTRKQLLERRSRNWENTKDGRHIKATCLAHCFKGVFAGTFWTVWEHAITVNGVTETSRHIGCDLIRFDRDGGWGYKDMDESMHPYYYSCPLKYLDMVPVACEKWREGVRKYHAERAAIKAQRKALKTPA